MPKPSSVPLKRIERAILVLRGRKVMLDEDLAAMYGVETKALVRAVKRNEERFPSDFMFQLSLEELENLRYQNGTSSSWGGRRYLPYAFTEQGVAMLSSVLKSRRAAQVNIAIMRAFVRLREALTLPGELTAKLAALERKIAGHDESIRTLFEAIRQLMAAPEKPRRSIGFRVEEGGRGTDRSGSRRGPEDDLAVGWRVPRSERRKSGSRKPRHPRTKVPGISFSSGHSRTRIDVRAG